VYPDSGKSNFSGFSKLNFLPYGNLSIGRFNLANPNTLSPPLPNDAFTF
jgi:hypothetical protein